MEDTLKTLLEKLYEEIKHGDAEHQQWLKDKIMDFYDRHKSVKRTYIVPVGNITLGDAEKVLEKYKTSIVNDKTGEIDFKYNPESPGEDYFIPVNDK